MNRDDLLELEADAWARLQAMRIAYQGAHEAWRETLEALELDARQFGPVLPPPGYVFPNTRAPKG